MWLPLAPVIIVKNFPDCDGGASNCDGGASTPGTGADDSASTSFDPRVDIVTPGTLVD